VEACLAGRCDGRLWHEREVHDRDVCVDVRNGWDVDAGRLDDADDVDADAGPDVARRRGIVRRHVDRDDGGDDASVTRPDAVALPESVEAHGARLEALTALAATGYFLVWAIAGLAVFALGSVLGSVEMRYSTLARTVPIAVGVIVLVAGAMQLTAWKARVLACCRGSLGPRRLPDDAGTAWRHGLRLGLTAPAAAST
jgi:hypothetical protein